MGRDYISITFEGDGSLPTGEEFAEMEQALTGEMLVPYNFVNIEGETGPNEPSEEDYARWEQEEASNGEDPLKGAVDPTGGFEDSKEHVDIEEFEVND